MKEGVKGKYGFFFLVFGLDDDVLSLFCSLVLLSFDYTVLVV